MAFGADSLPFEPLYDLYGIVNHYGSMGGGHYKANIKSASNEWLEYDDNKVRVIAEGEVRTPAAYILFYKRRDLQGKPMHEIIP